MSLLDRVRALLGDDAVEIASGPDAVPRVAPASPDAVALLLGTARQEGWRVRLEGAGTWLPTDAPADLALTTRRLDRIPAVEPQDLSATAEAGIGCDLLRQQLADHGTWLALDPPGLAGRTLGSVVATATAGPLRHGFGPVRDHVIKAMWEASNGMYSEETVAEVLYNKASVQNVSLQLEIRNGVVAVPQLSAVLPGDMALQAQSTISGDAARPRVDDKGLA